MKNYVYTDLSVKRSLVLEIGDQDDPENIQSYDVSQFSTSFAINEIPTAVAMLAIGREFHTQKPARIHTKSDYVQMDRATIFFQPEQEYDPDNKWPGTRLQIFSGYFLGFAYRKINGKITVVAHLLHFLAGLTFSSCVNRTGHVSNPTSLNVAAILGSLKTTGTDKEKEKENSGSAPQSGAGGGQYISQLPGCNAVAPTAVDDLWNAIKQYLVAMANIPLMPVSVAQECEGGGDTKTNGVAANILSKIEPFAGGTYKNGVPLKIDVPSGLQGLLQQAIGLDLGNSQIASFATKSMWDKIVGEFCPRYGMALVPMCQSAIVIADVPALGGDAEFPFPRFWRSIDTIESDALDMNAELHLPIQMVAIWGGWTTQTMAFEDAASNQDQAQAQVTLTGLIGGCFAEDSIAPGDGLRLYINPPPVVQILAGQMPVYAGHNFNLFNRGASRAAGADANSPMPPVSRPGTLGNPVNELCNRYCHDYYVQQMLRGRNGMVAGKLRFDIAPGSIIRIEGSSEKIIGGEDSMAVPLFGCVQRVTIGINAEAGMAGTTFTLSHIRTETEASKPRTSVTEHPLFGTSIHGNGAHGSPLLDELAFG
jgi:hypothetical protein